MRAQSAREQDYAWPGGGVDQLEFFVKLVSEITVDRKTKTGALGTATPKFVPFSA